MIQRIICTALLGCCVSTCFSFSNMLYIDNRLSAKSYSNQSLIESIAKNHAAIQILSPQTYRVNELGTVWGDTSPKALEICKKNNIPVMPLVINAGFDSKLLHQLLHDQAAIKAAILQLVHICKRNNFIGMQLDFEHINIKDKDAYTQFVNQVTTAFHKSSLQLSVTVLPHLFPPNLKSHYSAWHYDNWTGGYDIKNLANACDFITLMAYDRHTSLTTPGPIAPLPWVKTVLKNTLKVVSANKLMLGIPFYSGFWSTTRKGTAIGSREHQISYQDAVTIQEQYKTKAKWDSKSGTAFAILQHPSGLYSYLYVENARSIAALLKLAKKHNLKGISGWQMGLEDPAIWPLLNI